MALEEGRQPKHSDDVYTDPRKLCLGGKLGRQARMGGLEYMGHLRRDRMPSRGTADDGYYV